MPAHAYRSDPFTPKAYWLPQQSLAVDATQLRGVAYSLTRDPNDLLLVGRERGAFTPRGEEP